MARTFDRARFGARRDIVQFQRRLKALGVVAPPPDGVPSDPDAGKRGVFYRLQTNDLPTLTAYARKLRALLDRDEGKWTADAHLHAVLRVALAAAPEGERPPAPHHGGVAARPAFRGLGHFRVALFVADAVARVVPKPQRARFDEWVQHARTVRGPAWSLDNAALTKLSRAVCRKEGATFRYDVAPGTPPAIAVANGAALAAYFFVVGGSGDTWTRDSARIAVELLASKPGAVRAFLRALDDAILREDLAAVLEGREETPVKTALWRAAADNKATHWLGVLEDDRHVLVYKLKGKWRVFTGARDDVLASVPDAHMDSAVRAIMGARAR